MGEYPFHSAYGFGYAPSVPASAVANPVTGPAAASYFVPVPAPAFVVDRRPWWRRHPILTTLGVLWLLGATSDEPALLALLAVVFAALYGVRRHRAAVVRRTREDAAIAARADAQHQAYLNGDPAGIYGFPIAAPEPRVSTPPVPYGYVQPRYVAPRYALPPQPVPGAPYISAAPHVPAASGYRPHAAYPHAMQPRAFRPPYRR
ncbi:hypothetical protein [Rhodococcus chondri]|uniref:Integral membrane protein n=1 Tax=Rhodococcus chondri TaxID=3065941 RepID=A0ABU7K182_9NOCA|nr:hypothetical protein [Rhodococcus sp. CC-R104]MEE2035292.1 hypothetical protein [Rhodococcus sp. CC-R104]